MFDVDYFYFPQSVPSCGNPQKKSGGMTQFPPWLRYWVPFPFLNPPCRGIYFKYIRKFFGVAYLEIDQSRTGPAGCIPDTYMPSSSMQKIETHQDTALKGKKLDSMHRALSHLKLLKRLFCTYTDPKEVSFGCLKEETIRLQI